MPSRSGSPATASGPVRDSTAPTLMGAVLFCADAGRQKVLARAEAMAKR